MPHPPPESIGGAPVLPEYEDAKRPDGGGRPILASNPRRGAAEPCPWRDTPRLVRGTAGGERLRKQRGRWATCLTIGGVGSNVRS